VSSGKSSAARVILAEVTSSGDRAIWIGSPPPAVSLKDGGAKKLQVAPESEPSKEDECGYTYDHDIRDMGDGVWECRRCGAEGWYDDEEEGA
jgi:hypothetical protein